ncbi:AraC family transcriptional regulator [Mariniflexile litorale]|uniref:AraC family transcriptional regulator n=1 Tax=Mariniflexile litorale TaxID=3045158 RepID=A0AAU7EH97_9FLAO|nr:AraC family transcriptional regulator [Mariniflexile sp. KMM 9835]MDQ8210857.1 AraC family transcriptional regulator [Mariniflexile sp. KMM 9835]
MDNSTFKDGFIGQKMIVLPSEAKTRVKNNLITSHFFISDLGYFPKASYHFIKRKKNHDDYIFIYCVEGRGKVKINDLNTTISPNEYIIIPKHTAHSYKSHKEDPWSIYWMHFDGIIANALYERHKLSYNKIIPFNNDRIKLFNQIFEIFNSNYIDTQLEYANILSLTFLSSFIYNAIETSINIHKNDNLVGSIIDFLNYNIDKSYKSEDIAEEFNLSTSYIHTIFKKRTGYSLIHFFNLKKIQKACEYLNYTDLNIKEISIKLGINDALYFSRLFKKYMGVSPKTYKESHNQL